MSIPNPGWPTRRPLWAGVLIASLCLAILAGSALAANLVKNGSFEKDSNGDGLPNSWELNIEAGSIDGDKRVCNQSYAGECSFKMVGDTTNKSLFQSIPVGGPAGTEVNFSVRTKGKLLTGGFTYAFVQFYHTGGGSNSETFIFPGGTTPWTLYQFSVAASQNFDSIGIGFFISADSGKVWFDKVKLVEGA